MVFPNPYLYAFAHLDDLPRSIAYLIGGNMQQSLVNVLQCAELRWPVKAEDSFPAARK